MEISDKLPSPTEHLSYRAYAPIYQAFVEQAVQTPDKIALVSCHGECSYGDLDRISRQIAHCLLAHGVRAQARVSILSDRNLALVYAMLGVLRAGAVFNIADAAYPTARFLQSLQLVQPSVLLVCGQVPIPRELQEHINRSGELTILRIPAPATEALEAFAEYDQGALAEKVNVEDTAYIIFTSGTTGQPKGIATSHAPLRHFIDWHVTQHGFTARDRFAMLSGLSHDPLLRDVFTPLSIGAMLCIPKQATIYDPAELFDWLRQYGIAVCHLTPGLGEIIALGSDNPMRMLPQLRYLFWGGDALSLKTSKRLREVASAAAQVNFYGATETPQAIAYFPIPSDCREGVIPIGRGIADTQLLLVTEDGHQANTGELGEIWVRSPYLAQGYLDDPDQTLTRFVANPFSEKPGDLCYRTGDLGKYLPDGNVTFAGRMDYQVKIRGFRVEPAEVSSTIERFAGISRALVLASDRESDGKVLTAYYTCLPGQSVANHELQSFLRNTLPAYMAPTFFVQIERFTLLPNGKIDMHALPAPTQDNIPAGDDYLAPCNAMEAELVKIWQDILGIDRIGVNDSFLSLGGDSLSALIALARMRKLGIPAEVARGITQGKSIRDIVGQEGGERRAETKITAEFRTILLINMLRGIFLVLVILSHWFEGFLNLILGKGNGAAWLWATNPLFSIATPGFDYIFGAGLGFFFYARYRSNPAQTRKTLLLGALLLAAGIFVSAAMSLADLSWQEIDSTVFFNHFFGALLYYALALITIPLWFRLIAKSRREYSACAALAVFSYLAYHMCLWLFLAHEQTGLLQLGRLMLVARFNYFTMSIGTFGGLMAGLYLKEHYAEELSWRYLGLGTAGIASGLALLFSRGGSIQELFDAADISLWRWAFYGGAVLLLAGGIDAILKHFNALPEVARTALRMSSALGQVTFPLYVLSDLVLSGERLLLRAHWPRWICLGMPVGLFIVLSCWLIFKVYQLYFGGASRLAVNRNQAAMGSE